MKSLILAVIGAACAPLCHADTIYKCDYAYMGMPTTSVEALIYADGTPAAGVDVIMQGRSHKETATPETVASDEIVHLWLSKESAENSIEMMIYRDRTTDGNSKLVNHHVPFGQDIWGDCAATAAKLK